MFIIRLILILLVSSHSYGSETVQQVQNRIIKADSYRLPFDSGELFTSLALYQQGEVKESSEFFIQLNPQGESRVTMLNQRSEGQKVLLTESAMWLYVPRTHKAIRITPMQRLMGQASYGDVASLSLQHDYLWNKHPVSYQGDTGNQVCFTLDAKRQSATYRSIYLCLDNSTSRPISADFFLASGKLMKQALYLVDPNEPSLIKQTKFTQPNKEQQYTLMTNRDFIAKQHNKNIFTRQGFIQQ